MLAPYADSGLSQQTIGAITTISACFFGIFAIVMNTLFWCSVHRTMRLVPIQKRIYSNTLIWWILGCIVTASLISFFLVLFPENPATPFILSDTTLNLMLTSPLALAALVLSWMFLLIGVPHALRNTIPDNVEALRATNTLKKIGLWYLILSTVIFLICTPEVFLIKTLMLKPVAISMIVFFKSTISIAVFALWIIYWVKIVAFRKKYLVQVETK